MTSINPNRQPSNLKPTNQRPFTLSQAAGEIKKGEQIAGTKKPDGTLSFAEAKAAGSPFGRDQKLFNKVDTTHDGKIGKYELFNFFNRKDLKG